jgi:hypothetical protein
VQLNPLVPRVNNRLPAPQRFLAGSAVHSKLLSAVASCMTRDSHKEQYHDCTRHTEIRLLTSNWTRDSQRRRGCAGV